MHVIEALLAQKNSHSHSCASAKLFRNNLIPFSHLSVTLSLKLKSRYFDMKEVFVFCFQNEMSSYNFFLNIITYLVQILKPK